MSREPLYPESLARRCVEGKPYRPSNGTEGEMFQDRWCANCKKDDYEKGVYCPILSASLAFDTDDPEYPKEWNHGPDGQPRCTAFEERTPPAAGTGREVRP